MKINYNVKGADRKKLVAAISQELNAPTKYLGAPSFAYEVGSYHIDKNGVLTDDGEDNHDLVMRLQNNHGFVAISEEHTTPINEAPAFEDLQMAEAEELGLGRQRRDPIGEDGMQASDAPEPDSLVIEMPLEGFTPDKLDNLTKLVKTKESLIKAALGTDDLPIQVNEDRISFPWFECALDHDRLYAYTTFISLLCKTAKEQKRVTASERIVENKKYAFRCFLLRLGMIGAEYKACRHILLKNLEGNGAFKAKPETAEVNTDAVAD